MDDDSPSSRPATATRSLPPPRTSLRRHNSIATSVSLPANADLSVSLPLPATSTNGDPPNHRDELHTNDGHIKKPDKPPSYTSIKDLLPHFSPAAAIISSPSAASSGSSKSGYEISIRNRLVKQAAWAYLRPMSASSGSAGPGFIHRLWFRLCSPVNACLGFVASQLIPSITRALYRILQAIIHRSAR